VQAGCHIKKSFKGYSYRAETNCPQENSLSSSSDLRGKNNNFKHNLDSMERKECPQAPGI